MDPPFRTISLGKNKETQLKFRNFSKNKSIAMPFEIKKIVDISYFTTVQRIGMLQLLVF